MKNLPSERKNMTATQANTAKKSLSTHMIVQQVISDITGNDLEDITLDALIEDDLGVNMMTEFLPIIKGIQKQVDVILPIKEVKHCLTIAELVELIDEEKDL